MGKVRINNKELTEELLKEWLGRLDYLDEEKREELLKIAFNYYGGDLSALFEINKVLTKHKDRYIESKNNLTYKQSEDKHLLIYQGKTMEFTYEEIKEIIHGIIDILDEIHPLGIVVELKRQYLKKILGKQEIEEAQVVIISRFLFQKEVKSYFQYAGVVYPL